MADPRKTSRRAVLRTLLAAGASGFMGMEQVPHEATMPFGWLEHWFGGRKVFERGTGEKVVVLMHELNGLSPGCIDFGLELVCKGYRVFMPLLFGHPGQDNIFFGTIESCGFGGFHCKTENPKEDTKPVRWLSNFVESLCERNDIRAIGVIGMCMTGAFPLAAMNKGTKVKAVVLSQPALPLGASRQNSVGIADATMKKARNSGIPILAMRFKSDTISTVERYDFLSTYFGPAQFHGLQWDGPPQFHETMTHRLHAVLTGPFGDVREDARRAVFRFLQDNLP